MLNIVMSLLLGIREFYELYAFYRGESALCVACDGYLL